MIHKGKLLFALLACSLLPSPCLLAGEAQRQILGSHLPDLLAWVDGHNPELGAMDAESRAAQARVGASGALPDPRITVELMGIDNPDTGSNFTVQPNRVNSTKYTLSQEIPWWGKRDLEKNEALAMHRESLAEAKATRAQLRAAIKETFARLYQVNRNLHLNREMQTIMENLERFATVRYESGTASQQEAIDAQVELTMLRSERLDLEAMKAEREADLNALLSRSPVAPLADPQALPPLAVLPPLEELLKRVEEKNPEVTARRTGAEVATLKRERAYKDRFPDWMVGVSPVQAKNRIEEWQVMVEVAIPIQQGVRRARESEAEEAVIAANHRQRAAQFQASSELARHHAALSRAQQRETLLETALLPQSEAAFQAAMSGYETGAVDFSTLANAQHRIQNARIDLLDAQVEQREHLAAIERITGEDY